METVNGDWSTISEDIIEELVNHLKSTKHWKRDGRSLRALNRHWCAALTRRVVEVRPHSSRALCDEDIDSLSKFQNITALDAVPFEGDDIALRRGRCLKLVKMLSKLPHLRRLCVKDLLNHVEECNLSYLNSIKDIEFQDGQYINSDVLSKISKMQIEELAGDFSFESLNSLIPKMPSLKVLTTENCSGSRDGLHEFILQENRLEAISMAISGDWLGANMAEMQNLVSLILWSAPKTLEPLVGLLKLTSLRFFIDNGDILTSAAFQTIRERLISLRLFSRDGLLPIDFLEGVKALETLSLGKCKLHKELIEHLQKLPLKSLSLVDCDILDSTFPQGFLYLERLCVRYGKFPESFKGRLSPLQNLKNLTISLGKSHYLEFFDEIRYLPSLESLGILVLYPFFSAKELAGLEQLSQLRSLTFLQLPGRDIDMVADLKLLTNLEKLTLHGYVSFHDDPATRRTVKVIKKKAPYLKVETWITNQGEDVFWGILIQSLSAYEFERLCSYKNDNS